MDVKKKQKLEIDDGQTDLNLWGWMNGWMDGWMDGWMNKE